MLRNTTYDRARFDASVALGVGSALAGAVSSIFNTNSTNKQNLRIMREQNDWNERMWHMNNEYNSPLSQRQRMEAAGLNPNLFDMDSGVSASPAEAASSPTMLPNNMPAEILANLALQSSQVKLNEAAAEKDVSETDNNRVLNKYLDQIYQNQLDLGNVQIELGKAQKKLTRRQAKQIYYAGQLLSKQVDRFDETLAKLFSVQDSEVAKNNSETAKNILEAAEIPADHQSQRSLNKSTAAANYASAAESDSRTELNKKQSVFIDATWEQEVGLKVLNVRELTERLKQLERDNKLGDATFEFEVNGRRYQMMTDYATMRSTIVDMVVNENTRGQYGMTAKNMNDGPAIVRGLNAAVQYVTNALGNVLGGVGAAMIKR